MSRIQQIRNSLEQRKGELFQLESSISELEKGVKKATKGLKRHEKAREIVREVGLKTQQRLSFHINDITSMALEAVFNDPYELVAEFVQRRNKTECDLYFSRWGEKVDPKEGSGVGAVDVAAFALRVASWSMQTPKKRNVIMLDEPFRYLDKEHQPLASQMIKEVSDKLGVQFIIITHEAALTIHADKTFQTRIRKGKTKIIES